MSKDEIHDMAQGSTPQAVNIPANWSGLLFWAATKWGIGIVGFVLLVPVYQDLKTANERFASITERTITVLNTMASDIRDNSTRIDHLESEIRRTTLRTPP